MTPGLRWRPVSKQADDSSIEMCRRCSAVNNTMFHDFTVASSWSGEAGCSVCRGREANLAACTEGRHPLFLPRPLLLYWPAHIGGWRRRIWRGRLVKVTLLIQTHRNASRWPALFLLSQHVAPPFACASFSYWDFFLPFFFLMVVHGQSPAAFRPAVRPGGASELRCQAPTSLHPNTSSALSCKYHQQLVGRNLVVLNK